MLQFWVPEIDNQSEMETGNFQIVNHLPFLAVTNGINGFRINDDLFENDDIRYEFTYKTTLVLVTNEPKSSEWTKVERHGFKGDSEAQRADFKLAQGNAL